VNGVIRKSLLVLSFAWLVSACRDSSTPWHGPTSPRSTARGEAHPETPDAASRGLGDAAVEPANDAADTLGSAPSFNGACGPRNVAPGTTTPEGFWEERGCRVKIDASDRPEFGAIAVDNSHVYWTSAAGVKMAPLTDLGAVTVAVTAFRSVPVALAVHEQTLYFATNERGSCCPRECGSVGKIQPGTGPTVVLASVCSHVDHVAVDDSNVYFTTADAVMAVPVRGGGSRTVTRLSARATSLVVDGTGVYWTDRASRAVMSVGLGGGVGSQRVGFVGDSACVAVDSATFFVRSEGHKVPGDTTRWTSGALTTAPMDGGTRHAIAISEDQESAQTCLVTVDSANVYWSNYGALFRMARTGGEPLSLIDVNPPPFEHVKGLATRDGVVYWTERVENMDEATGATSTIEGKVWALFPWEQARKRP
jgi:hypothetical protein